MSGFSAQTRVGNWSEQAIKEAETLERLTAQREAGTLRSDVHARRLAAANARVPVPPLGDDGCLRFGQPTGVVSAAGEGVLAACIHDAVLTPELRACAAVLANHSSVSSLDSSVVARCCVALESVAARSVDDEASALTRTGGPDVVHYGQKVRIRLCPEQCADAPPRLRSDSSSTSPAPCLYLRTGPVSTSAMARHSKHQLVAWTALTGSDTVWVVLTPDPAQQAVSEGQPVLRHAPVLLRHSATQQCLAAETFAVLTDFGTEREVSCFTSFVGGAGHRDALQAVAHGAPEAGVVKTPGTPNVWRFI